MTLVYVAIGIWTAAIIINLVGYKLAERGHRHTVEQDEYCDRLDQEWDELEARRRTRPHGNCDVIPGPWVREHPPTFGPFDRSGGAA